MPFEISHLKNKIYYSQNREDLILEAFFPEVTKGFYVDVGAYDPDYDSVTRLFYKKGWHGINVEPQPDRFKKFVSLRKRDTNLNNGISDKKGSLTLRAYKNGGLSTFSNDMKKQYEKETSSDVSEFQDIKVPITTLRDVFKEHAPEVIHFLKIDIEGLEYEALSGNDWKKYRPQVLCIESNHMVKNWKQLILDEGYEFVFFDGLNDYYAAKESGRAKTFDYVQHILTVRGGGIGYSDYRAVADFDREAALRVAQLTVELGKARQHIGELEGEIATLKGYLESPKILARRLMRLTANKLATPQRKVEK